MAQEILIYLSLIIAISAFLTVIVRVIKQPPIIAYLIAGILVGPLYLKLIGPASAASELIQVFAHIGVAFLLFIVGLNLDLRVLKEVGKVSTFAGLSEIIITGFIGGLIALAIGFSSITALYIGAALAFSSTVLVVKILSDKKEIDTLHGRIALGILIVEDFVAALALMIIPLLEYGGSPSIILTKLASVAVLIFLVFLCSIFLFQRFLNYLARNQEVLFLFGIAWALILATLFDILGFSLEIGALIAGMSLASSKYTLELGGKIKPLRDFFIVLFFVFFGSQLSESISLELLTNAIIFSVFVVIGKPIIVMAILRLFGYKKRTNFLAGSSLAQISEFSLILVLLGFSLGHLGHETMSLAVLIAIITIGASSYSIYYAHTIFSKISRFLTIFEGKHARTQVEKKVEYEAILIGYHRIGYKILESLKKLKMPFIVIDYNPKVILSLAEERINCIYGDAGDPDFLSQIDLTKVKLIVSTMPDEPSNLTIKEKLKKLRSKAVFIATAEQPRTAYDLYKHGIDYVIIPHHLGGSYASHIIEQFKTDKNKYRNLGYRHFQDLKKGKNNSSFM